MCERSPLQCKGEALRTSKDSKNSVRSTVCQRQQDMDQEHNLPLIAVRRGGLGFVREAGALSVQRARMRQSSHERAYRDIVRDDKMTMPVAWKARPSPSLPHLSHLLSNALSSFWPSCTTASSHGDAATSRPPSAARTHRQLSPQCINHHRHVHAAVYKTDVPCRQTLDPLFTKFGATSGSFDARQHPRSGRHILNAVSGERHEHSSRTTGSH